MPNMFYSDLVVTGTPEDLRRFKHAVRSLEPDPSTGKLPVVDFERHVPTPEELLLGGTRAGVRTFAKRPGDEAAWDLHAWRGEHWGTKWNAMYSTLSGTLKSGRLRYRFGTAWSPPWKWLDAVARAHPELTFELTAEGDFDASARGRWRRGARVAEPELLEISIGGFDADAVEIRLEGDQLAIEGETAAGEEWLGLPTTPSARAWRRFFILLDELDAWYWPADFQDPEGRVVLDGAWWSVDIEWDGYAVHSGGENSYPPDGEPELTREFRRFCKAVEKLAGVQIL